MPTASLSAPPAVEAKPRLSGVQALRGIAAMSVVLCHAARHVNKVFGAPILIDLFQAGHAGVDLFFVISGFIIVFVHQHDIGHPERLRHYLGRRFNRVMPLYWIALAITITMSAAGSHIFPPAGKILLSASLLPTTAEPLLGIAWTLQYEVVFYAAFALLIVNRTAGIAAFLVWLLAIVLTTAGLAGATLPPPLSGPYGLEFFFGMAAASVVTRYRFGAARFIALLGTIAFGICLVLESTGLLDGFGVAARFLYASSAFLLLTGIAASERRGLFSVPAWLKQAGEASYSIYLFQFVFIGIVWQAWVKSGLTNPHFAPGCFLALAVAAIAGGMLVSRFIEHPLFATLSQGTPPEIKVFLVLFLQKKNVFLPTNPRPPIAAA